MSFRIKLEGFEKIQKVVEPKIFKKAQNRTIREVARNFRKNITKDVRETYNIKAKEIKKHIEIHNQNGKFTMYIRGRTKSLMHFGARQTKKGVTVKVKRKEGRKLIAGAFIRQGQVFMRETKARLPIESKKTLSVPQMFRPEIVEKNLKEAASRYEEKFKHNLLFYLGKIK